MPSISSQSLYDSRYLKLDLSNDPLTGADLTWTLAADGALGPLFEPYHNSASPAENDVIFKQSFYGNDDGDNKTEYARFQVKATTVADGSEEANIEWFASNDGSVGAIPLKMRQTGFSRTDTETITGGGGVINLEGQWEVSTTGSTNIDATIGCIATDNTINLTVVDGAITATGIAFNLACAIEDTISGTGSNSGKWKGFNVDITDSDWSGSGTKTLLDFQHNSISHFSGTINASSNLDITMGNATRAGGTWTIKGDTSDNNAFEIDAANNYDVKFGSASLGTQPEIFTFGDWNFDKQAANSPSANWIDGNDDSFQIIKIAGTPGRVDLIASDAIALKPSADLNDYLTVSTISNVPTITAVGDCNMDFVCGEGVFNFEINADASTGICSFTNAGTGEVDLQVGQNIEALAGQVKAATNLDAPKWQNIGGNCEIDAFDNAADTALTINNSDGTYNCNVTLDGDFTMSGVAPILKIEGTSTTDPTAIFKTTNTAHEVKVYLDENAVNDVLVVGGQTASVDTLLAIAAQDGENAGLLLYSGANYSQVAMDPSDNLVLENTVQNKDIILRGDDGGVTKSITWDVSADTLLHDAGQFKIGDAVYIRDGATANQALRVSNSTGTNDIVLFEDDGVDKFRMIDGGFIGVNATPVVTVQVNVQFNSSSATAGEGGLNFVAEQTVARTAGTLVGAQGFVRTQAASAWDVSGAGNLVGVLAQGQHRGTGTVSLIKGVDSFVSNQNTRTGTITDARCYNTIMDAEDGTITTGYGLRVNTPLIDNGNIVNFYGVYVKEVSGADTINCEMFLENGGGIFFRDPDTEISSDTTDEIQVKVGGAEVAEFDATSITFASDFDISAKNIITDTTTGTKIATAIDQKVGFFNATPVVQQAYTAVSNPPTQAEVTAIRDALVNLGLMAAS